MAKKGKAKNGAPTGEGEQVSVPAAPVVANTPPVAAVPARPAVEKPNAPAVQSTNEVKLDVKPVQQQNGAEVETGEMRRKRSRRGGRGGKKKSDDEDQSKDKAPSTVTARKNLRKKRSKLMRTLEQLETSPPQPVADGAPVQTAEDIRKKVQVIENLLQHLQAQTQEERKKMENLKKAQAEQAEPAKKEEQPAQKTPAPGSPKNLTTEKTRKEAEAKKLAGEKAVIQNEAKRLVEEKARKEQEMKKLIAEKAKKDAEAKQLFEEKAAREAELAKLTQAKARVETVEQKMNELDQKAQQRKEVDETKVAPGSPKQKKDQGRTRKDSESNKKKEAEEKAKKEAEEKAKKETAEKVKKEAEEKAKKEAAEKAKKEAEEKAKKEAAEKAKKEAEEKAKKEATEKAKKEAEEKAKKEAAEKAKKEAEEKAKKEAAEKAKKEAEEKAKKEAAEKAKKEAEEKAKKEAAEKAKKEAEEKAKKEAAEKAKKEAEEKAKKEAAEKAKKEAEEKAKKEAAEKAKREAEEKAKKEAAEKAKKEAEEKSKKEAAEKAKHEAEEKAKKEAEEKAKKEAAEKAKKQAEEEAKRKTNGDAVKQANGSAPTTPTQEKPAPSKQDTKNNKKNNKRTPKNSVSEDDKSTAKATGSKNGPSGDFASSAEPVTVAKSQESQSAPVPIPKTAEAAPASPKASPKPANVNKPAAAPVNGKQQTPPAKTPEKPATQAKSSARSSPPKTTAKAPSPPKTPAPAAARATPSKPSTPPASKKPEPPPKPEFLKKKSPSVEKEKIVKPAAPQQVSQPPAANPSPPSSATPAPSSTPAPAVPAPATTVPTPASSAPAAAPAQEGAVSTRLTEEALNGAKKPAPAGTASKPKPVQKKPDVPPKPDVHSKSAAKMKTPIKQPGGKTTSTVTMTSEPVQNKHLTTIQSDSRSAAAAELSRTEAFKKNMDIISTIADVLLSCSRSKKTRTTERPSANASEPTATNTNSPLPSSNSTTSLEPPALPSSASLLSSLFPTLSQSSGPAGTGSSHQASASSSSTDEQAPNKKSKLDLERILRILQTGQPPSSSSSASDPSSSSIQQLPLEMPAGTESDENPLGSFLTKDAIRMLMPTLQEVNHKFNVEKQLHALNATAAMSKILPKTLPPGTDTTEDDELEEDLLDEEAEDTIEYKFTPRPVFIATICQVCKNPLKSFCHCERCNMVSYCGEEHRRTDLAFHRELCTVLCEVAAIRGGHIYQLARKLNVQEYRNLRVHTLNQIELTLKRPMQAYEREIVLFPRICIAPDCREWRQELLTECTDCRQISYCADNPSHLQTSHQRWCKAYLLFQKLILRQRILGRIEPVLPARILTKPAPLPANIDEAFKQLYKNSTVPRDECVYAVLSQIATAPLSALYAYQQTGLPFGSTFTIHLVGAELQFEGDTLDKWEAFFLHLVPEVAVLRVVFVGPELNVENLPIDVISRIRMCRTCRVKCRVVAFDFQCRTMYHDYRHSSRYQRPNLICFFNPGLHRTTGFAGQDSWPVTIRAATEAGCPMLVTAYTELESPLDLDRLQRESTRALQIVQPPSVNPYGSKRPDRNFISDDTAPMIFKNYYYFVVK